MGSVQKQSKGPKIIDQQVNKFQGIVKGLDKGIALCVESKEQNKEAITELATENKTLSEKAEQAIIFRDNLNDMLTKKDSTKKSSSETKNKED